MFSTCMTTMRDFESEWYLKWKSHLEFSDRIHRKFWEIAIVSETLESQGKLCRGMKGVGFGVGSESLAITFADRVERILATDLLPDDWQETHHGFFTLGQHPRIENRIVDMNWINGESGKGAVEAGEYDFSWSVCSMDHCGKVWWTKRFLLNQMNCLRHGGVGVHTAEYTINVGMPRDGTTVWLTRDDVVDVVQLLTWLGHDVAPIDWFIGDRFEDHGIDCFPYNGNCHIKTEAHGRWGTCICFCVRKNGAEKFWVPIDETEARAAIAKYHLSHSQA